MILAPTKTSERICCRGQVEPMAGKEVATWPANCGTPRRLGVSLRYALMDMLFHLRLLIRPSGHESQYSMYTSVGRGATSVTIVVSGSDLPLRGVGLTDRSLQRRADGAVSRFGTMSLVTVRVTTLVSGPVKFSLTEL